MWAIVNEETGDVLKEEKASSKGFQLINGDSRLWLYTFLPDTKEGVYEIWRAVSHQITRKEALKNLISRKAETLQGYSREPIKNSLENSPALPPNNLKPSYTRHIQIERHSNLPSQNIDCQ